MRRFFFYFFVTVAVAAIWFGESRKFFCLSNGKCVTVWKTYNNVCYIIPGRYYGIIKPMDNYLESSNTDFLTIYFSDALPNTIIYKSEKPLKLKNADKDEIVFLDYDKDIQKWDSILYLPNAKRSNEVKSNAQLLDIIIKENYAMDKDGRHLGL